MERRSLTDSRAARYYPMRACRVRAERTLRYLDEPDRFAREVSALSCLETPSSGDGHRFVPTHSAVTTLAQRGWRGKGAALARSRCGGSACHSQPSLTRRSWGGARRGLLGAVLARSRLDLMRHVPLWRAIVERQSGRPWASRLAWSLGREWDTQDCGGRPRVARVSRAAIGCADAQRKPSGRCRRLTRTRAIHRVRTGGRP